VERKLKTSNAAFGIGGYKENRVLYRRSNLFDTTAEYNSNWIEMVGEHTGNRSLHLGIDIWAPARTKVFLPIEGTVHSFAYNEGFGDYGATIIMRHQLDTVVFHTLYGHISLADLEQLQPGKYFAKGELIAHFGEPHENGSWPPHLHFQVIEVMNNKAGDYPGVCSLEEMELYLQNCPDPDLILNLMQYARLEQGAGTTD
jgi:murein DD-endopeptidase MepM/ murein hydrolase activator NlpD